jgi:hypothetical protein
MLKRMIFTFIMVFIIVSTLSAQQFRLAVDRYDSLNLKEVRVMILDSTGQYINHGPFITWNIKGNRQSEGEYELGKINGIVTGYREDLTKESETVYYFGDKITAEKFDLRGMFKLSQVDTLKLLTRVEEVTLRDGQHVMKEGYDSKMKIFINHGPATVWYKKGGDIKEMGNFVKGKPHGLMTRWNPFGLKQYEGTFSNGKEDGVWIYWDKDGALESLTIYKDGKLIREIKP